MIIDRIITIYELHKANWRIWSKLTYRPANDVKRLCKTEVTIFKPKGVMHPNMSRRPLRLRLPKLYSINELGYQYCHSKCKTYAIPTTFTHYMCECYTNSNYFSNISIPLYQYLLTNIWTIYIIWLFLGITLWLIYYFSTHRLCG